MYKRKYSELLMILLIFISLFFFMNCEQSTSLEGNDADLIFDYTAFDSTGITVARGWLLLEFDDNNIKGGWKIEAVGSPQNIGPQTGSGELAGSIKDDSIWVELQPQWRDNNLQLLGIFSESDFAGEWIYISYAGPTNSGTFTAKKIS